MEECNILDPSLRPVLQVCFQDRSQGEDHDIRVQLDGVVFF